MKSIQVIFLIGPTASGKTDFLLNLAKKCPQSFEVVSVDSAQVYRGMDIGTAKVSPLEQQHLPHWLIDCVEVTDTFDVAHFIRKAQEACLAIYKRGKVPILSGGSMMYFDAIARGICPTPAISQAYQQQAQEWINDGSAWERLRDYDPNITQRIHPNDNQRIQRALSVYLSTNKPGRFHA